MAKAKARGASEVRAVVLAGGMGTRMRPLTAVLPKPLLPLGDRPILGILLDQLGSSGFENVTVCTGYLEELIRLVCGNGEKFGLRISFVSEPSPLGTAGPLANIGDWTDPVMVLNGDLLTSLNFEAMIDFHNEQGADITIAIHPREVKIDFGVVHVSSDLDFEGFVEKPTYDMHVAMGVNVLSREVRSYIQKNERLDMPDLISQVHEAGGKIRCYCEDCFWLDIGRMDDYGAAQELFETNSGLFIKD